MPGIPPAIEGWIALSMITTSHLAMNKCAHHDHDELKYEAEIKQCHEGRPNDVKYRATCNKANKAQRKEQSKRTATATSRDVETANENDVEDGQKVAARKRC